MSWHCLVCLNKFECPKATTDLASIAADMMEMSSELEPPCAAYESGCDKKEKAES